MNYKYSFNEDTHKSRGADHESALENGKRSADEIVEKMPAPKPHKNTVATILKTLVDKEFVEIENLGRIHRYHPIVLKEQYSKNTLTNFAKGYFEGSFTM